MRQTRSNSGRQGNGNEADHDMQPKSNGKRDSGSNQSSKPTSKTKVKAAPDFSHTTSSDEAPEAKAAHGFHKLNVPYGDKSIACQRHGGLEQASVQAPTLIFTHGAGGGLSNAATQGFICGFSSVSPPLVAFQGSMNLESRTKIFGAVLDHVCKERTAASSQVEPAPPALGGRSMGARAAVIAANNEDRGHPRTKALVLVSYPLLGGKQGHQVRDEILYEIDKDVEVLFVSGDKDKMCPMDRLTEVRRQMSARSWCMKVEGADHGMDTTGKAKKMVSQMRSKTGEIAANWLQKREDKCTECTLSWDEEEETFTLDQWKEEASDEYSARHAIDTEQRLESTECSKRKSTKSAEKESPSKRAKLS